MTSPALLLACALLAAPPVESPKLGWGGHGIGVELDLPSLDQAFASHVAWGTGLSGALSLQLDGHWMIRIRGMADLAVASLPESDGSSALEPAILGFFLSPQVIYRIGGRSTGWVPFVGVGPVLGLAAEYLPFHGFAPVGTAAPLAQAIRIDQTISAEHHHHFGSHGDDPDVAAGFGPGALASVGVEYNFSRVLAALATVDYLWFQRNGESPHTQTHLLRESLGLRVSF